MIEILPVSNNSDLRKFIDYPHELYRDDPSYVPQLFTEQKALLDKKTSPFLKHSEAAYYLAVKEGKTVGRIAAILNNNHIKFTGKQEGFFGFFDVINDYEVAKTLLDTASKWLMTHGIKKIIGPSNFSTNETLGLLISGFDEPPFIMMPYNAAYYIILLEKYGFTKHLDLLSYFIEATDFPKELNEKAGQLEQRLAERNITIRNIDMKNFKSDLTKFLIVYNESWAVNADFVPMTNDELMHSAKDLKTIIDPDFIFFAEKNGVPIGISLTVPNVNELLIKVRRGRLLPLGVFKILFGLKEIKTVRTLALGTLPGYRRLGIDLCFYYKSVQLCLRKGIRGGEASWILENNIAMNQAIIRMNGKITHRYRLYEKGLSL